MSELGVIEERARQTPVVARPDVLVVGGGRAGIAAACAAARTGARTMLVERYGFLGGTLTAVTLGGFCGGYGLFGDELREVVGGFYRELVERLRARDAVHSVRRIGKVHTVPYDPSRLRLVLDETLDAQGVDLLLHTQVVDVVRQGSVVEAVIVANKAGRGAIVPRMVIDCSGDGDVAFLAGAEFVLGDGKGMQYASSMFRMLGVDVATFAGLTREQATERLERAVADGHALTRTTVAPWTGPVPDVVHLNATKITRPDGSPFNLADPRELTAAEKEGRRQAYLYEEVMRQYLPGFAQGRIVELGANLGVRETRHILGDHVLSEHDFETCRKPDDGVVCSAWPMEIHEQGRKTTWKHLPDGEYYKIPYRSLLVRDFSNLLVAGRNFSATHLAQASARVAAICCGMGEAAGTAAAMALATGNDARAIDVQALLADLERHGAILDPMAG